MQTKTIDGKTFEVTLFGAKQAIRVLTRLTSMVAPGLSAADQNERAILAALGEVAKHANPEDVEWLCDEMAGVTTFVGKNQRQPLSAVYDALFRGNLTLWAKWLAFALEVNFADFFRDVLAQTIGAQVEEAE